VRLQCQQGADPVAIGAVHQCGSASGPVQGFGKLAGIGAGQIAGAGDRDIQVFHSQRFGEATLVVVAGFRRRAQVNDGADPTALCLAQVLWPRPPAAIDARARETDIGKIHPCSGHRPAWRDTAFCSHLALPFQTDFQSDSMRAAPLKRCA